MSGATIGGVIGYAIGSYFGPVGAQIGWMIGSAVGGYVDPTIIEGPRLKDLRGTTSSVGNVIPRAWGTAPVPCNIIWQQPGVTEHRHEDDGKGSGTEQRTYTYTRSYAVMFHLGEIAGILQVKRNGKVVYDARTDAELLAEYQAAVDAGVHSQADVFRLMARRRALNSQWQAKCRFYYGTQDQEPDPTIESYEGVGNVPSYRGRAYMVVTNDETTAGEIAQYEVIVASCGDLETAGGTGGPWLATFGTEGGNTLETSYDAEGWGNDAFTVEGWLPAVGGSPSVEFVRSRTEVVLFNNGNSLYTNDHGQTFTYTPFSAGFGSGNGLVRVGSNYYAASTNGTLRSTDGKTFIAPAGAAATNAIGYIGGRLVGIRHAGDPGVIVTCENPSDTPQAWVAVGLLPNLFNPSAHTRMTQSGSTLALICIENNVSGSLDRPHILCTDDPTAEIWEEASSPFADAEVQSTCIHYSSQMGMWIVAFNDRLAYGPSPGALTLCPHTFSYPILSIDAFLGKVVVALAGGGLVASSSDLITWEESALGTTGSVFAALSMFSDADMVSVPGAPGTWVDENGYTVVPPTDILTPCETTTIGEIVADLCDAAGLAPDEYDVSDLTDTLTGFVVARETDMASVVESLRHVGLFDPAEWDGKLRFVKRGGVVAGAINADDLVDRDGDAFEREMVQEAELLRRVTVGYLDSAAAFAPNTQKYERRAGTVQARGEATVEVSAVMTANHAATVAKRKVLTAWGEPERQKFSLPYRLSKYTPTDVLSYTDADGEVTAARLMQIEDESGVRKVEASLNCAEAYNATATGVTPRPPPPGVDDLRGPTNAVYMNLPSLRTQDNVPGVTIAASGFVPGWPGATILLSADDGVSYQEVARFSTPSTMGRLTADCTDSSEPISVRMSSGQLSSITDAQLAARQNAFAITTDSVSELGQFKTATPTDTNLYDLTDTVRGLLGTATTSHIEGDRFVMVSTAQFVPLDIGLSGRTLYFKAVTFGTSADAAVAVPFVFNPLFTSVTVSPLTHGGETVTVDGSPIYVVTSNA